MKVLCFLLVLVLMLSSFGCRSPYIPRKNDYRPRGDVPKANTKICINHYEDIGDEGNLETLIVWQYLDQPNRVRIMYVKTAIIGLGADHDGGRMYMVEDYSELPGFYLRPFKFE